MALTGLRKDRNNWVSYRYNQQKTEWPSIARALDEKFNGVRFRSELLSYSDLLEIYLKGAEDSDEEDKKKSKGKKSEVIPAKAFALPGRFNERGEYHETKEDEYDNIPEGWGYLHFDQWLYARDQARKELYWLCKEVFGLDVQPHVHQVVCDQFVSKNFDGVYKEGYNSRHFQAALSNQCRVPFQWFSTDEYVSNSTERRKTVLERLSIGDFGGYVLDPVEKEKRTNIARTMILLDPRGFFKSTIDIVDCIQWILNCPDIRILILSGVKELAEVFLTGVKQMPAERKKMSFYLPDDVEPDPLHLLFPEYVIRGVSGSSQEPLKISQDASKYLRGHSAIHPTLGVISVGSSLSGFRCDILKFDDAVTDNNCLTDETRAKVKSKADGSINLLMPWGWHDIIGTRYFPDDYYGLTKETHDKDPESYNLKFFQRACWTVKEEFKSVERRSLFELTESMVDLTFPELAGDSHKSWLNLREKLHKDPRLFKCQQLNLPSLGDDDGTVKFERILLETQRNKTLSELVSIKQPELRLVGAIDLAKENKQFSDNTALAVGMIYQEGISNFFENQPEYQSEGKFVLVILDIQYGKWSQVEIARRIAAMNNKWKQLIGNKLIEWRGEDTGGLELLKEKIIEVSKTEYGHWPSIWWIDPENSENAKRNRVKGAELLLRAKRLYFLNSPDMNWGDIFDLLEKYKGQKSTRYFKDDVPDVIGYLTRFVPALVRLSKEELAAKAKHEETEYAKRILQAQHDQIFGSNRGGFETPSQFNYYYREPNEDNKPKGPLSGIFGGNGLRA